MFTCNCRGIGRHLDGHVIRSSAGYHKWETLGTLFACVAATPKPLTLPPADPLRLRSARHHPLSPPASPGSRHAGFEAPEADAVRARALVGEGPGHRQQDDQRPGGDSENGSKNWMRKR